MHIILAVLIILQQNLEQNKCREKMFPGLGRGT